MAGVTAIIGATVAAASLAYTISSSEQQKRAQKAGQDQANQDAQDARTAADAAQKSKDGTDQRNLDLSNERRRVGGTSTAGVNVASPLGSSVTPGAAVAPATVSNASATSPATVTRGSTTLLGF